MCTIEQIQEAKKYLDEQGYGTGSNFTLNAVANLMAEWSAKNCNLQNVSNNEADLNCDYDITAKVPFKSKKRYKVKVISEVAVCPYCDTELEDASQDVCMDCWNKYRNP